MSTLVIIAKTARLGISFAVNTRRQNLSTHTRPDETRHANPWAGGTARHHFLAVHIWTHSSHRQAVRSR